MMKDWWIVWTHFSREQVARECDNIKTKWKKKKYFNQDSNLGTECAIILYHFEFARQLDAQLHQFDMNTLWPTLYHWAIETVMKKILQIENMIHEMQLRRPSRTQRFNDVHTQKL